MSSRKTVFLLWVATLVFAALFFLGEGRFGLRSLDGFWDLGHLAAFALFAYMLVTRSKRLSRSPFLTQLIVALGILALVGLSIELLQLCVGRTFSWLDLSKDLVGTAIGIVFCAPERKKLPQKFHLGLKLICIGLVLWEAFPFGRDFLDETIARRQFPLLSGLETPFERGRWSGGAQYFVDRSVHHQGRASLRVVLGTEEYSGVALDYFPRDWRGYAFLSFDILNPGSEPIDLTCRVNDTVHQLRGNHYEDRFNRTYRFNPGWQTVRISLEEIRKTPRERSMNMEAIDNFAIFAIRLPRPRTIYIDNVRLDP